MKLTVTTEFRFLALADGSIWTETAFPYSHWKLYLSIYTELTIIARARQVSSIPPGACLASGPQVKFALLPSYVGPTGYLINRNKMKSIIKGCLDRQNAVILSVPSPIALIAESILHQAKHPYGVEVLGDPWEVFAKNGIKHRFRRYFRFALTRQMKRQVRNAVSASFVTQKSLQKRYPPGSSALSFAVSNIDLQPAHLVAAPKQFHPGSTLHLVSIGSLEQLYKNPEIVILAVAECRKLGMDVRLTWVGGGKYLEEMIKITKTLGVEPYVNFVGHLPAGEKVRAQLDQADLFILASKTEGLPRALIEAMARGLPCLGSAVGGIPELLNPDSLLLPNSTQAIIDKVQQLFSQPQILNLMAKQNLDRCKEFLRENLDRKRLDFLTSVKNQTARALK